MFGFTSQDGRHRGDTARQTYWSVPKVCRNVGRGDLRLLLSCIQTYIKKPRSRTNFELEGVVVRDSGGPILQTFSRLLNWTASYGFHAEEFRKTSETFASIDWHHTLAQLPIISGKTLTFPSIFSSERRTQHGRLAEIQAAALIDMAKQLGPLLELWIAPASSLLDEAAEFLTHRSLEPLTYPTIIGDVIDNTNRDHERELSEILLEWINENTRTQLAPRLYGVNAFHVVWEDMCRTVMSAVGVPIEHVDVASQPFLKNEQTTVSLPPQRPDLLYYASGDVFVIDAKWYDWANGRYPSTPDLIKQLVYEMSLSPGIAVRKSYFTVPTHNDGRPIRLVGNAGLAFDVEDARFPNVGILGLDWEWMLTQYSRTNGSKLDLADIAPAAEFA